MKASEVFDGADVKNVKNSKNTKDAGTTKNMHEPIKTSMVESGTVR